MWWNLSGQFCAPMLLVSPRRRRAVETTSDCFGTAGAEAEFLRELRRRVDAWERERTERAEWLEDVLPQIQVAASVLAQELEVASERMKNPDGELRLVETLFGHETAETLRERREANGHA